MALREILARFGIQVDGAEQLNKLDKSIGATKGKLGDLLGLVGGAAIVGGFRQMAGQLDQLEGHIVDTSAQLGLHTDELQRWELAGRLAGAEAADLATAFRFLQKNQADAAKDANGSQAKAFKELGLNIKDSTGELKASGPFLKEVGLAIAAIESPAKRTEALMTLLGKSGGKLGPLFNQGAAGLDQALAEIDKLGGPIGEDALANLGEFNDQMVKAEVSTNKLKVAIANKLYPTLTQLLEKTFGWSKGLQDATKNTQLLQSGLGILAVIAGKFAITTYGKYLPLIALFAAATLLVEDLTVWLQGGNSATGALLDSLFGLGTGAEVAGKVNKAFQELNATWSSGASLVDKLKGTVDALTGAEQGTTASDLETVGRGELPADSMTKVLIDELSGKSKTQYGGDSIVEGIRSGQRGNQSAGNDAAQKLAAYLPEDFEERINALPDLPFLDKAGTIADIARARAGQYASGMTPLADSAAMAGSTPDAQIKMFLMAMRESQQGTDELLAATYKSDRAIGAGGVLATDENGRTGRVGGLGEQWRVGDTAQQVTIDARQTITVEVKDGEQAKAITDAAAQQQGVMVTRAKAAVQRQPR
mgnify:FL=1